MIYSDAYQNILNKIAAFYVYTGSSLNLDDIENVNCVEFEYYFNLFKEKFEKENENKNEFIQNTFEFARNCVEVICKTIANVWGGGNSNIQSKISDLSSSIKDLNYK